MSDLLVNRVAQSGLITINLEKYFPKNEMVEFDLKDYLFMDFVLKEKDFRSALKDLDWSEYNDKIVLVFCSNDAIIPMWAYMLVTTYLQDAHDVYVGNQEDYLNHHYNVIIDKIEADQYLDKKIVIKGCSNHPVPAGAYQKLTALLTPVACSIMYGEPCSTVPIYKKPKK